MDERDNPFGCRLMASTQLSREDVKAYADFSEALWFALAQGMLPPVQNRKTLEAALAKWTDRKLLEL